MTGGNPPEVSGRVENRFHGSGFWILSYPGDIPADRRPGSYPAHPSAGLHRLCAHGHIPLMTDQGGKAAGERKRDEYGVQSGSWMVTRKSYIDDVTLSKFR